MKQSGIPPQENPGAAADATHGPGERDSAFAALSTPAFRWLWVANVVSGIGSMMHATAASWLLVTEAGAPTLVILLQVMMSLPVFLFALPAGALADLVDKRRVVLGAQVGGFVVAAVLTGLSMAGMADAMVLLGSAFALQVASAFGFPAWQALLPELVSKPQWPSAITLGSIAVNLARALGPVAGGLLIGFAPASVVFGINALSFLLVALVVQRTRPEIPAPAGNSEPFFSAMAAAVWHIRCLGSPCLGQLTQHGSLHLALAVAAGGLGLAVLAGW